MSPEVEAVLRELRDREPHRRLDPASADAARLRAGRHMQAALDALGDACAALSANPTPAQLCALASAHAALAVCERLQITPIPLEDAS